MGDFAFETVSSSVISQNKGTTCVLWNPAASRFFFKSAKKHPTWCLSYSARILVKFSQEQVQKILIVEKFLANL